MKLLYPVILLTLCFVMITAAQTNYLTNGGFESWTNGLPTGWTTDILSVTESTNAHSGSAAVKLGNYLFLGIAVLPGELYQAAPAAGSSFSLKGWYQLKSDSGDGFFVTIFASKVGATVGAGEQKFFQVQSVYTAFAVGVDMYPSTTADTCSINIMMLPNSTTSKSHITAYALIDDLVLDNTVTGVASKGFALPSTYQLLQRITRTRSTLRPKSSSRLRRSSMLR